MSRAATARSVDLNPSTAWKKSEDARRDDRPPEGRSGARRRRKRAARRATSKSARARIADSEAGLAEVAALRMERESIRGRVSDMLEQLEGLSL